MHAPIFVYTKRIAVSSLSATRFDKYFPWKNISGHWKATQQQRRTISWRLDKYKWNIRICATRWSRWWYEQKAGLASGIETRIGQHPDRLNKYFWGALCGLTHTQPTHTSEWCVCVCVWLTSLHQTFGENIYQKSRGPKGHQMTCDVFWRENFKI